MEKQPTNDVYDRNAFVDWYKNNQEDLDVPMATAWQIWIAGFKVGHNHGTSDAS
jgi:hypothetical protein